VTDGPVTAAADRGWVPAASGGRPALTSGRLTHTARDRSVGVTFGSGQQLPDPANQRGHAGAGDRGAEEHRVHEGPPSLGGESGPKPLVGRGALVVVHDH
jgi:hypothetical protein